MLQGGCCAGDGGVGIEAFTASGKEPRVPEIVSKFGSA